MRTLWTERTVEAPVGAVWTVLTDLETWPLWGPSVRHVRLDDDRLGVGAQGTLTTVGGVRLPFEITAWDPPRRWAWKVAGVGATDHVVEPVGPTACRVRFGVPWWAAPYLVVCRSALAGIDALAG